MSDGAGVVVASPDGTRIVDVVTDPGGKERLAVSDVFPPGGPSSEFTYPLNLDLLHHGRLKNVGNADMAVDGSITPVAFTFDADPVKDVFVALLRIAMTAQDITFDGASMGMAPGLTNGFKFEVTYNNGSNFVVAEPKINEDWLLTGSTDILNNTGAKDIWTINFRFNGVKLAAGTADAVKLTVRDNLNLPGSNKFYFLQAEAFTVEAP